jgi:hypothetical protein
MANRNRIVTPRTDPDRFTREEKAAFNASKCCWDLGDTMCHKPSKRDAPFGYCAEHERVLLEGHHPDGSPRR